MRKSKKNIKQVGLFILDKSGSMETIRRQAISGFNEYIQTLKAKKIEMDFSLVLFDSESIDKPYQHVTIKQVEPLTENTYQPRGMTPLFDSCVDAIEDLTVYTQKLKGKTAVSVVIMTDGEENASTRHDQKCLRDLVTKLTKQGNWTFAYMGANQDAWANASQYGITRGNVLGWASTDLGTKSAFRGLADATVNYCASVSASNGPSMSTSFFSDLVKNGGDKNVA